MGIYENIHMISYDITDNLGVPPFQETSIWEYSCDITDFYEGLLDDFGEYHHEI